MAGYDRDSNRKFHFLPVFVIKNFQGMIHASERAIHYPNFDDRCGEHWAIVHEERVFEVPAPERGDMLNRLQPALMLVDIYDTYKVGRGLLGFLRDLDGKYVAGNFDDFMHMTIAELDDKIHGADTEWIGRTYGPPRQNYGDISGEIKAAIDLRSGLLIESPIEVGGDE